jgi:hypothetical protein
MICKNCGHEILEYCYSVPANAGGSLTGVRQSYVYYHVSGFMKYGKSYCWEWVRPITGEVKRWVDPADWCLCDNPEPPEVEKYEFASTPE